MCIAVLVPNHCARAAHIGDFPAPPKVAESEGEKNEKEVFASRILRGSLLLLPFPEWNFRIKLDFLSPPPTHKWLPTLTLLWLFTVAARKGGKKEGARVLVVVFYRQNRGLYSKDVVGVVVADAAFLVLTRLELMLFLLLLRMLQLRLMFLCLQMLQLGLMLVGIFFCCWWWWCCYCFCCFVSWKKSD